MKKGKILLSFSIVLILLLIVVGGFYLYQSSKKIKPSEIKTITIDEPSPTPVSGLFLTIDSPQDESVVNDRTVKVSGKTLPGAKIVIITPTDEEGAVAAKDGTFSTDITLDQDENIIEINAISSNGESVKTKRVVSYSTENF